MKAQIHFHALREDLISVIQIFESESPIDYIQLGHVLQPSYKVFYSGLELPNLGIANSESVSGCTSYLIKERHEEINLRPIDLYNGERRYSIDQLMNPNTVCFTPGGLWKKEISLEGYMATVSDTKPARDLMKRFHKAIKQHFTKIKAFYVGPKALEMLKSGKRLAIAEQSPREYDLSMD